MKQGPGGLGLIMMKSKEGFDGPWQEWRRRARKEFGVVDARTVHGLARCASVSDGKSDPYRYSWMRRRQRMGKRQNLQNGKAQVAALAILLQPYLAVLTGFFRPWRARYRLAGTGE